MFPVSAGNTGPPPPFSRKVPSSRSTGLPPSSSHAMFHLLEVLAFHHHFHVMIHLLKVLTLHHHLLFHLNQHIFLPENLKLIGMNEILLYS
ncbi:hypothetical protein AHAS_Ahas07G0161400 [Arachis hypogaea]